MNIQLLRSITIIACLSFLTGCLGVAYNHPTASQSEFLQARYECTKGAAGFKMTNGTGASCIQGFAQCLAAKGYTKTRSSRLKVGRGQAVRAC